MLHLKNSCRSFGVHAKLDVPQKDAVAKKHGILYTTACKECKDVRCENK